MPPSLKYITLAVILLLLVSIPLAKQLENGSIEGFITDDFGSVAGGSVEARNVTSGAYLRTASDSTGYYQIGGVRPGRYSLWVQEERHNPAWIMSVLVEHGQCAREDVHLNRISESMPTTMRR